MAIQGTYVPGTWDRAADQVEEYERSGGSEGAEVQGVPCIILWTRGKRSGSVRKSPLIRVTDGQRYAAVGSIGGAPQHPSWYFNILASPEEVSLQDGAEVRDYHARVLDGVEKLEWWDRAVVAWPPYEEYQARTERVIPVVLLEPVDQP